MPTAVFDYTPDNEQIVLPVGNEAETRQHIEIFITEQLADGEDVEKLVINHSSINPDVWIANYIFDLQAQQLTFTRRTAELEES